MPSDLAELILGLDPWIKLFLSVAAAAAVLAGISRWVTPRVRNVKADARAIRDTLVGREAQKDTITGREIAPAVPGIGERMADQEQHQIRMAEEMGILTRAVADLASAQAEMTAVQGRLDDHERRLTAIEQGHMYERLAGKAESIHLFRAVEAIAKDEDPTAPDADI